MIFEMSIDIPIKLQLKLLYALTLFQHDFFSRFFCFVCEMEDNYHLL